MTAALVLAAGEGRRFGGPKQLAEVDGRPLIEHALAAVRGVGPIHVVLGARADQPFITAAAVARVLASPGPAVRAVYDGAPGHPVVLRGPLLARAGELRGDTGFRDLLEDVVEVECGDLANPLDIDTREDLEVVRR